MGFLSGVLGAVKDDENVKHYYPVDKMNKTLKTIKDSMYKTGGLSTAVDAVSAALGEWDTEVTAKTSALRNELDRLINNHINNISASLNNLNILTDNDSLMYVAEHLDKCMNNAGNLIDAYRFAEATYGTLDATLRDKLKDSLYDIKLQVNEFVTASRNDELKALMTFNDAQLKQSMHVVKSLIDNYSTDLQRYLTKRVDHFKRRLEDFRDRQFAELCGSIGCLLPALNKLMESIANLEVKYRDDIVAGVSSLKIASTAFYAKIKKTQTALSNVMEITEGDIKKLKDLSNNFAFVRDGGQPVSTPLLTAIGNNQNPFENVTSYFTKLDDEVMTLLTVAMKQVGDVLEGFSIYPGNHEIDRKKQQILAADVAIQALSQIDAEGLKQIQIADKKLILEFTALDKLSSHVGIAAIKSAAAELRLSDKINVDNHVLLTAFKKLLAELSQIPQDVYDHSQQVVGQVMQEIKTQVTQEIRDAAEAIYEKAKKIYDGIKNSDNDEFDYGEYGPNMRNAATGLLKIVNDYNMDIDTVLKTLHEKVGTDKDQKDVQHTVYSELTHVKRTIDELDRLVDKVRTNVERVLEEYDACIRHANVLLVAFPQKVDDIFTELNKEINVEITNSAAAIRRKTKDEYYTKMYPMMLALKHKIYTEIQTMDKIIEEDCEIGVKGLLRRLHGGPFQREISAEVSENKLATITKAMGNGHMDLRRFKPLCEAFLNYLTPITFFVGQHIWLSLNPEGSTSNPYFTKAQNILNKLKDFLEYLLNNDARICIFDDGFSKSLSTLSSATSALDPQALPDAGRPVLKALRDGMMGFVGELGKGYVSRYDGGETIKEWVKRDGKNDVLTPEGKNGAKVFLTILETLKTNIDYLKEKCPNGWKDMQIYLKGPKNKENPLGEFFVKCGYDVCKSHDSHEGHLRNKANCKGSNILTKLNEIKLSKGSVFDHITNCESNKDVKTGKQKDTKEVYISDLLTCLYHHLDKYNEVCHLSTLDSKKKPCSVFEMLCWLSGLTHNPVHQGKLSLSIMHILEDLMKKGEANKVEKDEAASIYKAESTHEDDEISEDGSLTISYVKSEEISLDAHPRKISYDDMWQCVTNIGANSYDVLVAIAGHGDEFTIYGSDFSNNSMKFHYPQIGEDCLDMFLDILRRVFPPLKFLLSQCGNYSSDCGWYHCKYGKEVHPSKWQCKDHSKSKVDCQPTSPLMSYLNDCLPGHLPHQLSSIGCKYDCATCPSTSRKGQPCITPLGFRGFSGSTKTGKDLCSMLSKIIDNKHLASLFCLVTKPPKTLPEHFGFALSLVKGWSNISKLQNKNVPNVSFQSAFETSVRGLSIDLYSEPYELTKSLTKAYGSQSVFHEDCKHPHLVNFTSPDICRYDIADVTCAPYLQSLCADSYEYMAIKHCDLYLSWAIYLSWDFWRLLNNLYNDFCNILCADWGCRGCLRGDTCKKGSHGLTDEKRGNPRCQCPSIVDCNGVTPTLYRYGFGFCDAVKLNDDKYKKKCSDFCSQLNKLLTSQYFKDLFTECDNFIWTIREPFTYLVLALWSLSLFYLICVIVGRLDVLHIRSHLRIPSSHRITAQSLLAAAQVGKLAKISYLRP